MPRFNNIIKHLITHINKLENIQLFGLLVSIELTGLVVLSININNLIEVSGILPISVLLFISPVIFVSIYDESNKIKRYQSLILLFIPIIFINYIFYIKVGLPVGFQDVHDHIFQSENIFNLNHINFNNARVVSFNFVGLYLAHNSISSVCGVDMVLTAAVIPPFFNILCALFAYLFVNRIFSHKIAVIATIFYALENTVIHFGEEMRTQTMGTLMIFGIMLMITLIYSKNNTSKAIIMTLFLAALSFTAFVPWFYTTIIFICIIGSCFIFKEKKNALVSLNAFFLLIIFFIGYIIYIGNSLESFLQVFVNLFQENFVESVVTNSPKVGQVIYGNFIKWFTYAFWGIYIISSIYFLKKIINKEVDMPQISFFGSFSFLFLFCYASSVFGELNPGRVYIVVLILIGSTVSYLFFRLIRLEIFSKYNQSIKIIISIFIILFVSTSLAKFPNGIIGDTSPIRGYTNIDDYEYWYVDDMDYVPAGFSSDHVFNKTLHLHMPINRHMYLDLFKQNKHLTKKDFDENVSLYEKIESNSIIILENSEHGKKFAGRSLYKSEIMYNILFNKLYSNNDYQLYYKSV